MKCHVCGYKDKVDFPRVVTTIAATGMLIAPTYYTPQQSYGSVSLGYAWIDKLHFCPQCGTVKVNVMSKYEKENENG